MLLGEVGQKIVQEDTVMISEPGLANAKIIYVPRGAWLHVSVVNLDQDTSGQNWRNEQKN